MTKIAFFESESGMVGAQYVADDQEVPSTWFVVSTDEAASVTQPWGPPAERTWDRTLGRPRASTAEEKAARNVRITPEQRAGKRGVDACDELWPDNASLSRPATRADIKAVFERMRGT